METGEQNFILENKKLFIFHSGIYGKFTKLR